MSLEYQFSHGRYDLRFYDVPLCSICGCCFVTHKLLYENFSKVLLLVKQLRIHIQAKLDVLPVLNFFLAETRLRRMLQLKELNMILVLSDLTLNPRIITHHSRTSLGVTCQKIWRDPKPKFHKNLLLNGVLEAHLIWYLALMMQTRHTLIFLLSLRSLVLLSLKVLHLYICAISFSNSFSPDCKDRLS